MNRKDREKLQRKNEILNAAVSLFAENGYENTTIDEIAEKAEFGKGTLYNYFQNKSDIFKGIVEKTMNEQYETVKSLAEDTSTFKEFAERLTTRMFEKCDESRSEFLLVAKLKMTGNLSLYNCKEYCVTMNKEIEDIYLNKIIGAQKNGELKMHNPVSILNVFRNSVFAYLFHKVVMNEDKKQEIDFETQLLLDVLFNGLMKK